MGEFMFSIHMFIMMFHFNHFTSDRYEGIVLLPAIYLEANCEVVKAKVDLQFFFF